MIFRAFFLCMLWLPLILQADPPYSGTSFIDPDILTSNDRTTFVSISYTGRDDRTVYDRRVANWITINAY